MVENGVETTVVEKSDRVGGRITSDYIDGFTIDRGFQVVNPAYAELRETGALEEINFFELPKGVEIASSNGLLRVGDLRSDLRYLKDLLRSETGSLREKLNFLFYLTKKTEDVEFEVALRRSPKLFRNVLKPFLDGVFLCDASRVSNLMARELIHWFIRGNPGLPMGGVREVSERLAAGLDIQLETEVMKVSNQEVVTSNGIMRADAVINALDPINSARVMEILPPKMNQSQTWYFQLESGEIGSKYLRVGGAGPVVSSVVISNIVESYAPKGKALMAATTLGSSTESDVRGHLKQVWQRETSNWNLLKVHQIKESLPFHPPKKPLVSSSVKEDGIYLAGDWLSTPSQQGALLSGRRAANAVIADL